MHSNTEIQLLVDLEQPGLVLPHGLSVLGELLYLDLQKLDSPVFLLQLLQ